MATRDLHSKSSDAESSQAGEPSANELAPTPSEAKVPEGTDADSAPSSSAPPVVVESVTPPLKVFTCHVCGLYANYVYHGRRPLERHSLKSTTHQPTSEDVDKDKKRTSSSGGNRPGFAESLVLLEDAYVCDDPFGEPKAANYLVLGANCCSCSRMVCVNAQCSLFYYTRRFCGACAERVAQAHPDEFPAEIRREIAARAERAGAT